MFRILKLRIPRVDCTPLYFRLSRDVVLYTDINGMLVFHSLLRQQLSLRNLVQGQQPSGCSKSHAHETQMRPSALRQALVKILTLWICGLYQ